MTTAASARSAKLLATTALVPALFAMAAPVWGQERGGQGGEGTNAPGGVSNTLPGGTGGTGASGSQVGSGGGGGGGAGVTGGRGGNGSGGAAGGASGANGQAGSNGAGGGGGGGGNSTLVTLSAGVNYAPVSLLAQSGGDGGAGSLLSGGGGGGGAGASIIIAGGGSSTVRVDSNILVQGGAGGAGGAGGTFASGGDGGDGGTAIVATGIRTLTVNGQLRGGAGGNGGSGGRFGWGGNGGAGLNMTGGALVNTGSIFGGARGLGELPGSGGAGVIATSVAITNSGTIAGGDGGVSSEGIAVASGIVGNNITLNNTGTISGGLDGFGVRGLALRLSGTNTITSVGTLNGGVAVTSGTTTFDIATDQTLASVISGPGSIAKLGVGRLTLTADNTYTGTTTISAGTLRIGDGGTTGSLGKGEVINNASLVFDRSDFFVVETIINGTGSVTKRGAGTLALQFANGFSGGLFVDEGQVNFAPGALGSGSVILADGTTLSNSALNNQDVANNISIADGGTATFANETGLRVDLLGIVSGGNLVKTGLGTVVFENNANSFASLDVRQGAVGIAANGGFGIGTVTLQDDTAIVARAANLNVGNAINLVGTGRILPSGETLTLSGNISGGTLVKSGTGTLILTGTNTYGATSILQDIVQIDDGNAIGTGTITIAGGATLRLGLPGGSNVTLVNDIVLSGGTGTISTPANGLSINLVSGANNAGSFAQLEGDISGPGALRLSNFGLFTLSGNNTYEGGTTLDNVYVRVGSDQAFGTGAITTSSIAGLFVNDAGVTRTLSNNLGGGFVTIGGPGDLVLNGAVSVSLEKVGSGVLTLNNAANTIGGINVYAGTIKAGANGALGGGALQILRSATLQAGVNSLNIGNSINVFGSAALTVDTQAFDAVLNGTIAGSGGLAKTGSGTLTLTGTNTYTGRTTISAGTLRIASAGAIGSGAIVLGDGTTLRLGTSESFDITLGNAIELSGGTAIISLNGSSLSIAGIPGAVSGPANTTLSGPITGSGGLRFDGLGIARLSGNNTYSGDTFLRSTYVDVASNSAFGTGIIRSSGSTGIIVSNGAAYIIGNDLVVNETYIGGPGSLTLNGVVSGTNGIVKIGQGVLAFNRTNSFTGGLRIVAGTIAVGASGALGSGTIALLRSAVLRADADAALANAFTPGLFESLLTVDTQTFNLTLGGARTVTGLNKLGTGTLILTGAGTNAAPITITAGTLQVGDGGSTGTLGSGDVVNNGTLAFNRADDITAANVISGTGGLTKLGGGTLTLTGANTYSGLTTIASGTLLATNNNALGSSAGGTVVETTGTLALQGGVTLADAITLNGNGVIALGAVRSISGPNILTGPITLASASTIRSDAGTVQINGTVNNGGHLLTVSGLGDVHFVSAISGAGGLTKTGSGQTRISGVNTYTGTTTVTNGRLVTEGGAAIADSGAVVVNGGTLALRASETIGSLAGTGGVVRSDTSSGVITLTVGGNGLSTTYGGRITDGFGSVTALTKIGTGALTLTGASTYTGRTRVEQGTLTVASGGSLTGTSDLFINDTSGRTAGISVEGGSIATGQIVIGGDGKGSLSVTGGGSVTATNIAMALFGGTSGSLQVDGDGSILTTTQGITVGALGNAKATVTNGGIIRSGLVRIGAGSGSTGSVVIDGAGSAWESSNTMAVGFNGSGSLTLSNGGRLSALGVFVNGTFNIGAAEGEPAAGAGFIDPLGIDVGETGVLVFNHTDTDYLFDGVITGVGDVRHLAGTTILDRVNRHSGDVSVTGGTLVVNGTLNSAVTVTGTGALGGSGTLGGNVTIGDGGTLAAGNSPGTLTIAGDLDLNAGSTSIFELGEAGVAGGANNDLVAVGGNLALNGGTIRIVRGAGYGSGQYTLFTFGSLSGALGNMILDPIDGGFLGTLALADNALLLNTASTADMVWWNGATTSPTGAVVGGDGTWSLAGGNFTNAPGTVSGAWAGNGALAIFGGTAGTVTIAAGEVLSPSGLSFRTDGYVINAADSTAGLGLTGPTGIDTATGVGATINAVISGSGSLTKTGAGTLTLTASNTFTGLTTVLGGTLVNQGGIAGDVAVASRLTNAGTIGGALEVLDGGRTINLAGATISGGATVQAGGTLVSTGSIAGGLENNGGADIAGVLTGDVLNNGTIRLTGLTTGMAAFTQTAAGRLELARFDTTLGSLAGNGAVALGAGRLTLGGDNSSTSFQGVISGTGGLTKTGTGTFTLVGPQSYTGTTIVSGGTLATSGRLSGSVQNEANLILSGELVGDLTNNGTALIANQIGGNVLNTGDITAAEGAIVLGRFSQTAGSSFDTGGGNIAIGSLDGAGAINLRGGSLALGFDNTSSNFTGVISGGGSLAKRGTGTFILTGANTYTGATFIDAGALVISAGGAVGGDVNNNARLDNAGTIAGNVGAAPDTVTVNSGTIAGVLGNEGVLTNSGTISAGVFNLGTMNSTGTIGGFLNNSGAAQVRGAINGLVLNSGTLTLTGTTTGITTFAQSATATSNLAGFDTALGRLEGAGTIMLGGARLTVGSANASTEFSGVIAGSGGLTKTGSGTLVLTGANAYTGGTTISGGILQIGDGGTTGSIVGPVVNNTALRFNRSDAYTFGGGISGAGMVVQSGGGTTTLTGSNTYTGGTLVARGRLVGNTASLQGLIQIDAPAVLEFAQGTAGTFAGSLLGRGLLDKTGAGLLTLTGNSNSFTGATVVRSGELQVNGGLAGSRVVVQSGATLSGTGVIGGLAVNPGGILAPGTSAGALGVAGNILLDTGSTVRFEVSASGPSDLILATGSASLNGTASLSNLGGTYAFGSEIVLLQAEGGRTGTFANATGLTGFGNIYRPELVYTGTQVRLRFAPNSLANIVGGNSAVAGLTANQRAVLGGIDAAVTAGYNPQPLFNIYALPVAQLPNAFDQLSGEVYATAAGVGIEQERLLREAVLGRAASVAAAGRDAPEAATGFGAWGQLFGGWGDGESNGNAAAFEADRMGFVSGLDYGEASDSGSWRAGLFGMRVQSDVTIAARGSAAEVKQAGGGAYASLATGGFGVTLGGYLAEVDLRAFRDITLPGFADSTVGVTEGKARQAFAEISYTLEAGKSAIRPFVAGSLGRVRVDGFTETGGAAALTMSSQSYDTGTVTGGIDARIPVGKTLRLDGTLAARARLGDRDPQASLALAAAPQQAFAINGSQLDRLAVAARLEAQLQLEENLSISLGYTGLIGKTQTDQGARATLQLVF